MIRKRAILENISDLAARMDNMGNIWGALARLQGCQDQANKELDERIRNLSEMIRELSERTRKLEEAREEAAEEVQKAERAFTEGVANILNYEIGGKK